MDYTKNKTFACFKHTQDKNTYWINGGWMFDQETPGLFPYDTREDKKIVEDVANSIATHWEVKNLELVILKVVSSSDVKIPKKNEIKTEGDEIVKKRTRGPNKPKIKSE